MVTGSIYERELKGILSGDKEIIKRVVKSCSEDEKRAYYKIAEKPFLVIRAAGSMGVDLVAIRGDISFPIEVKSSSNSIIRFSQASGRQQEQAEQMQKECKKAEVIPLYAFRLKKYRGDSWRIFSMEIDKLVGRMKTLQRRIPTISSSKGGNYILRWDEGLPRCRTSSAQLGKILR